MAFDPLTKSHIHFPVFDSSGKLLREVTVELLDPETQEPVSPTAWLMVSSLDPISFPHSFAPGVVDLWLDEPGRYDISVVGNNEEFSMILHGVDFMPAIESMPRAPGKDVSFQLVPEAGAWLQGVSDGVAIFTQPPLVAPHDHSGATSGSTVLNGGSPVDTGSSQTWLGSGAGTGVVGSGTSSLGADSSPKGASSVAVSTGAMPSGTDGVVLSTNSTSGAQGVSLSDHTTVTTAGQVTLSYDSVGALNGLISSTETSLRWLTSKSNQVVIGSSITLPTGPPAGVTYPIWLLGLTNVMDGGLKVNGLAQVGGSATNKVGLYGTPGVVRTSNTFSGASGALSSLVAALRAYGMIP